MPLLGNDRHRLPRCAQDQCVRRTSQTEVTSKGPAGRNASQQQKAQLQRRRNSRQFCFRGSRTAFEAATPPNDSSSCSSETLWNAQKLPSCAPPRKGRLTGRQATTIVLRPFSL